MISNVSEVTPPQSHYRLIPSQVIREPQDIQLIPQQTQPPPSIADRLQTAQRAWQALLPGSFHQPAHPNSRTSNRRPIILSSENHTTNHPWGDPLQAKADGVTRIFSLNTNGLSLDQRGGRFDELCKVTKEVQADIVCCQEHNLDTTQSNVRRILYDTTRQHALVPFPTSVWFYTDPFSHAL